MKNFKKFMEDAPSMATTAVAGAGDDKIVPVHMKKKKKKKKDEVPVLTRTEKKK